MTVIKKNQTIAPFLGAKLNFIPGQDPMGMLNIGEANILYVIIRFKQRYR